MERRSGKAQVSKSSKSKLVASTNGFVSLGKVRLSLNVIS